MKSHQQIGRLALLLTALGGIVGSGWLLGPFFTARVAGPAAVVAWLLGGCLMISIALTFAELAACMPVSGSMARFAEFSHGKFTSFTIGWVTWLPAVMVAPIETMAALQYAANYIPSLATHVNGEMQLTEVGLAAAFIVMLLMCCINYFNVRVFAKSNVVIVIWKLIVPVIAALLLMKSRFNVQLFTDFGGFAPYGLKGILASLPTAGVIFSFIGYSPALQLAGEAKNPQTAIPFAIISSIFIAILLYCFIEFAFIGALDPSSVASGWHQLSFANDYGPIAGLLTAFGFSLFLQVIYADALISPLGTAFIYTASTARINIALSENQYFPSFMQDLNRHHSPFKAIMANFVIGLIFFLPFPGWQSMVSFLVSCFVVAYTIGPLACAALRKKLPDRARPFKLPFHHSLCLFAFFVCNLIVYWTGWVIIWKMLVTMLIGYTVFISQWLLRQKPYHLNLSAAAWLLPYFAGIGLISYLGSFGGGRNIIPFGYDFLFIGVLSIALYVFALSCADKHHLVDVPL